MRWGRIRNPREIKKIILSAGQYWETKCRTPQGSGSLTVSLRRGRSPAQPGAPVRREEIKNPLMIIRPTSNRSYQGLTNARSSPRPLPEGRPSRGRRSGGSSSPHAPGAPRRQPPVPGGENRSQGRGGKRKSPQAEPGARGEAKIPSGRAPRLRARRGDSSEGMAALTGCGERRRRAGRGAATSPGEERERQLRPSAGSGGQPALNSCALRPATTHGGRLKRQARRRGRGGSPQVAPPSPSGTAAFVPGPLGRA